MLYRLQYYTPPPDDFNKEFIKAVLCDDKKLFKVSEIKVINMPKYDELSCKNVSKLVRPDPVV